MKKILALLLALVMIISLLPLTAFAAAMPKYVINDGNLASRLERGIIPGEVTYIVFENVLDTDGTTVLGNKPAKAAEEPADNYIKMEFVDGVCQLLFKNVKYKRTAGTSDFLQIYKNSGGYTNEFDIVLTLEGENTIEGINTRMVFTNTGNMTVTGSGSLNFNTKLTSNVLFQKKDTGDLFIKDTTLDIGVYNEGDSQASTATVCVEGNIVVDNSTLNISGMKNYGMIVGTGYSTKLEDTTKGVTFKNGSNVVVESASLIPVYTNGPINVEYSNVELFKGAGNTSCFGSSIPFAKGVSVEMKKASGKTPYEYKDFASFELEEGIAINRDDHKLIGYKAVQQTVHQHIIKDCTLGSSICPCGNVFIKAEPSEHSFTTKAGTKATDATCQAPATYYIQCDNCTVISNTLTVPVGESMEHTPNGEADCEHDAVCTVCGKLLTESLGHTPRVDDGDCTTAVTCQKCNYVFTAAKQHIEVTSEQIDKQATCTQAGKKTMVTHCSICGKIFSTIEEVIPAKGHTEETHEQIDKQATCVEAGKKTIVTFCSVCSSVLGTSEEEIPISSKHNYEDGVCVDCGYILSCSHKNTEKLIGYAASCNKAGLTDGEMCIDCGDFIVAQEIILAKGHTPGAAADCKNDQICTVCGEVLTTKLGHALDEDSICTLCGKLIGPTVVRVKIYNGAASDFTLTLGDGDKVYLVADEGNVDLIKWTEVVAPTDNFVSFAYAADTGVLKTTFKNLVADQTEAGGYTFHGIEFTAGGYAVDIELIGENSLTHGKSSCIKYHNAGGMTITGAGSLDLTCTESVSGALWANGGDLLIKDTTVNFTVTPPSASAKHHAIFASKGSVTFDNAKITSTTFGGQLVFLGTSDAKYGRYTLDTATDRFITIKNSEITATAETEIFESTTAATVQNSTLTLTCTGSSGPIFAPAPVLEGYYTTLAGLAKNADQPEKLKPYDPRKLGSYTFIKITHEHTAADCLAGGMCVCGKQLDLPAAETHWFYKTCSDVMATEATCTKAATYYVRCDNCLQHTKYKRISVGSPLGHTLEEDDGDCTTAIHCTVCGDVAIHAHENHEVITEEIITLDPSCGKAGSKIIREGCYYCDVIISMQTVEIPATGIHTDYIYVEEWVEPTCIEDGSITITEYCYECDANLGSTVETIPATGHKLVRGETYAPSNSKKGYTLYTCEICGVQVKYEFVTLVSGDLQAAINVATDGEVLKLAKNYKNAATIIIPEGKRITLDLNGKYYSVGNVINNTVLLVEEGAELTLLGGSKLVVQASAAQQFDAAIKNAGRLTIKDVTVNANNLCADAIAIINTGDLTLAEGTVLDTIKATHLSNAGVIVNIAGIDIDAPEGYHWTAEGILEAHDYSIVTNVPATCETVSYDLHECVCGVSYKDNYGTKKLPVAAKLGSKRYATLQEAIDAAEDGDTVVLAMNIKDGKAIYIAANKKITIDLNSFYYTAAESVDGAVLMIEAGAEVVVRNGKLQVQYAARNLFDCVVKNNGNLIVENATINGNNLFKAGAATFINNGKIAIDVKTTVTVNKNNNILYVGNAIVLK